MDAVPQMSLMSIKELLYPLAGGLFLLHSGERKMCLSKTFQNISVRE